MALPFLIVAGFGGLEYINLVLANQKIERVASITADTIARHTLAPNEGTFLDTFSAANTVGKPFNVSTRGRVILTGVIGATANGTLVNKIVWQRCGGMLTSAQSNIGTEWTATMNYGDGPNTILPNNIVLQQNQMAVISEVAYRYEPFINSRQLVNAAPNEVIRQRMIYIARGQAFPFITPSPGVAPARC